MKRSLILAGIAGLLSLSIFGATTKMAGTPSKEAVAISSTYTKVKSSDELTDGSKIIIVNDSSKVAMSTAQNNNNRGQTSVVISNDNIIPSDDVQVITLEASESYWAFNVGTGYLYAASKSSNNLKTQKSVDDNGRWSISFSSSNDSATVTAQGSNTRNVLKYNSSNKLFSCYASGQNSIWIYKEATSKALSKIEIAGEPKKTSYIESESFDPTGLTVTATYDDESTADITSKVTWSPSSLSVGDTSVTATYVEGGKTFTATYEGITVSKKEIEIIGVSGKLNKTQYFVGETFDPSGLTVTGIDNIGNEFDLTDKVAWNLSTFDKEATYSSVTATYTSEDGLTITDDAKVDIEVKEKVLEGILVDTSNMKLDYTSFDTELDTTGLAVEACYPFDTYEDVTNNVTLSKPDFTKLGKQTITVTFEGETDTFEINVTKYPETSYTYIDSSINEGYYKVTETLEDWSGTYLITYCPDDTTAKVFNGLDETNGYTDAKVSSGFISPNESLVSVDIEKYDSGYAIKINNGDNEGKYISGKSGSNDLAFNKVASSCSIDFVGNSDITIISNGSYFRYNKNSGQNRFRFFRSSSYTSQAPIALFKYRTNKTTSLASNELLDAAYASLEELEKCDPNGVNSTYDWTIIENNFANITDEEKANLKTALSDGNGNVIERFLEKYDYLVGIKNQNDFLNREPSKQSSLNPLSPLPSKTSTTITYTCVFGISAITIASFLLLNRKRRHN